jgi:hypothetical protein
MTSSPAGQTARQQAALYPVLNERDCHMELVSPSLELLISDRSGYCPDGLAVHANDVGKQGARSAEDLVDITTLIANRPKVFTRLRQ